MEPSLNLGVFFLVGGLILRYAPIPRNYLLGYRTFRSMKNDANWKFANRESGKYLLIIGPVTMIAGILSSYMGFSPFPVIYFTIGLLFITIVIVEIRLKKFEIQQKK